MLWRLPTHSRWPPHRLTSSQTLGGSSVLVSCVLQDFVIRTEQGGPMLAKILTACKAVKRRNLGGECSECSGSFRLHTCAVEAAVGKIHAPRDLRAGFKSTRPDQFVHR